MALFEKFYEPCVLIQKDREPDGEGGWITNWIALDEFEAAVVRDTSTEVRIAESEGMSRSYTVTCPVGTALAFHSVFRRVRDGQIFRVTSEPIDITTPSVASFQFEQVTAEAWELPDE